MAVSIKRKAGRLGGRRTLRVLAVMAAVLGTEAIIQRHFDRKHSEAQR